MWVKSLIICLVLISSIDTRAIRVRRDLGNVCQNMWEASRNNMVVGGTDPDLTVDPNNAAKLFTLTKSGEEKLKQPVYTKFKALLDNYIVPNQPKPKKLNDEEKDFIDTIAFEDGPMDIAFKYLKAAGKTKCSDLKEFTDQELRSMWFGEYPKTDKVGQSSGFEHTFVGEIIGRDEKNNKVVKGLHNWYQFYLEQAAGRLTYIPPLLKTVDLNKKPLFIYPRFSWNGVKKPPGSSFYVGTSPAFEMALYTACFFGEPGNCTCSIHGRQLAITTIKLNFEGTGMVLTSYPTE